MAYRWVEHTTEVELEIEATFGSEALVVVHARA